MLFPTVAPCPAWTGDDARLSSVDLSRSLDILAFPDTSLPRLTGTPHRRYSCPRHWWHNRTRSWASATVHLRNLLESAVPGATKWSSRAGLFSKALYLAEPLFPPLVLIWLQSTPRPHPLRSLAPVKPAALVPIVRSAVA